MSEKPIRATCDACGKSMLLASRLAGRRVRCPNCTQTIQVADGETKRQTQRTKQNFVSHHPNEVVNDRYRLISQLGEGGFGSVWLAIDEHINRQVAIKLPKFDPSDEKRIARFIAEAQACAKLCHPNIVTLYDAGKWEGSPYLAIEFIDGISLESHLKKNSIDVESALAIVEQLADALHYAHELGIVHRDIKPQNIVITKDNTPKIVDFGLAKLLEQKQGITVDGALMGTPVYMAPEQARGATNETCPATDQYSLGLLLYWLLAGQVPFSGPSVSVIYQVIHDTPPSIPSIRPDIPGLLDAICQKAMSKSIPDRYVDCAQFHRDIRNFRTGNETVARPLTPYDRTMRWVKRNPADVMVLITVLFAISLGGFVSARGFVRAWSLSAQASKTCSEAQIELEKQNAIEGEIKLQLSQARTANDRAIAAVQLASKKRDEIELANIKLTEELANITNVSAGISKSQDVIKDTLAAQEKTQQEIQGLSERSEEINQLRDRFTVAQRYQRVGKMIERQDWQNAHKEIREINEAIDNPSWAILNYIIENRLTTIDLSGIEIDGEVQRLDWGTNTAYDNSNIIDIPTRQILYSYRKSAQDSRIPFFIPSLKQLFDEFGNRYPVGKSISQNKKSTDFSFMDFVWNSRTSTVYGIDKGLTDDQGLERIRVFEFVDKEWRQRWNQDTSKALGIKKQTLRRIEKFDDKSSFALIFSNDDAVIFSLGDGRNVTYDGVQPVNKTLPPEFAAHSIDRYVNVVTPNPDGNSWKEKSSGLNLKFSLPEKYRDSAASSSWKSWVTSDHTLLIATDGWIGFVDLK
jgi:serine/threonine protein kinase